MAAHRQEDQALDQTTNDPSDRPRVLLHMPVDVRSASLAFLALAASIGLLRWMHEFIVPVLLGVVLSYALTPLVDRLHARRIPRMLGAALVLSLMLGAIGAGGYALRHQAEAFITTLPAVAQRVKSAIAGTSDESEGTLSKVQRAANEIESAAKLPDRAPAASAGASGQPKPAASAAAGAPPVTRVVVEKAGLDLRDYFLSGTLGLVGFAGQALVVVFVALFLLASGNTFRRKMVLLAGPRLSQRRITVQALDEVHTQIQRYLVVQVVTSVLVGVMTWVAFLLIGLNNSAVWGVVAAVANLIPYVGAIIISGAASIVGFVQFADVHTGLLLGASSFGVHLIVGNLVTPWLTGKTSRMSPFVVFVGVLFFGWLWGVAGLVLAFPIMVTVKIVCDRVDDLKPLGELLGA
jgi:predicted PurR-regulated permease PerM